MYYVYHTIGRLSALFNAGLSFNALSGPIPSEIGMIYYILYLSNINLLIYVGGLSRLTTLALNNNKLTGAIPTTISGLTRLSLLSLLVNSLNGSIPSELGI